MEFVDIGTKKYNNNDQIISQQLIVMQILKKFNKLF